MKGEGTGAWNEGCDWGGEQGGRRRGFPKLESLPWLPQNLIPCSDSCLGLPPSVSDIWGQHWALYPGSSSRSYKAQHHESCLQPPLGSTAPSACLPLSTHCLPLEEEALPFPRQDCQLPNISTVSSETLTIQDSVPRRVNNFIQSYHLLSQICYLLTLKMSVSPLSDQFLCLLHMVRNLVLWMELSVPAKLGADCAPASVCTAAC